MRAKVIDRSLGTLGLVLASLVGGYFAYSIAVARVGAISTIAAVTLVVMVVSTICVTIQMWIE